MSIYDRMPPLFEQLPKEQQQAQLRKGLGENLYNFFRTYNTPTNMSMDVADAFKQKSQFDLLQNQDTVQSDITAKKQSIVNDLSQGRITTKKAEDELDKLKKKQEKLDTSIATQGDNPFVQNQRVEQEKAQTLISDTNLTPETPEVEEKDLKDLRNEEDELKDEIGTTGGDTDDNTNWFDRLNEKVDLMAMGAAMLAGSSSGRGTAANIGQALQVGIASRNKEQLQEEAKKRADAQLAIQLLAAQGRNRLTNPQSVGALEAELRVAGAEGDNVNTIANFLYNNPQMNYNMSLLNPTQRQEFLSEFVDIGQGWFGDEIEMGNVIDAGGKAFNRIAGK